MLKKDIFTHKAEKKTIKQRFGIFQSEYANFGIFPNAQFFVVIKKQFSKVITFSFLGPDDKSKSKPIIGTQNNQYHAHKMTIF